MKNINILDVFNIVRKDAVVWMIFIFFKMSLIIYVFFILMVVIFKKVPFGRHYNDYITIKDLGMFLLFALAIFLLLTVVVLYKLIIMICIIKNRTYLIAELLEAGYYISKECKYLSFKYSYRGEDFFGITAYHLSAFYKFPCDKKKTKIIVNSKNPKKILPIEIMGYNENYFQ